MNNVAQSLSNLRMSKTRIVMLLSGIAVVLILSWRMPGTSASAAPPAKADAGIAVETAVAARKDMPVYLEGLGTVQAFYTVTVTSRIDGQLQKVAFTEGQTVKQGDLLAQIDPRPNQAALDLAVATKAKDEAQLANAKRDLERYNVLAPEDLATKQTVDTQRALVVQLEAQIKGDQATIDNARTQLDYTHITSPITGRTGIRKVDPGNIVHAADTGGLVVVTQVQPISVIFTLPEDKLPNVATAMEAGPVTVTAVSRDEATTFDKGTIALIDNQIDTTSGTAKIKATFPNEHNMLWPGEFVNAHVLERTEKNALTIPSIAVQRGPNGVFTYVVKADSTVEVRPLKIGADSDQFTIVTDGLAEGDRVVTSNQYRLQPGATVRVTAPKTATAAAGEGTAS